MSAHYFKIAFRNLRKYKSQALISVIGLAIGFACFALATLWVRYELTFDNFHKNANQMYVVYTPSIHAPSGYSRIVRASTLLKETFPEIVHAIWLEPSALDAKITVAGMEVPAWIIVTDSSFFKMFDVKIVQGSRDFLIPGSNQIAITQKKARQLFGNEHPIGKTVTIDTDFISRYYAPDVLTKDVTICAIVSDLSQRSNYPFDFIHTRQSVESHTIIELFPGTDVTAFEKKLYEYNKMIIRPIAKLRYIDPDIQRDVKFQHIVIFAVSGLLVILCSLFNYLSLFASRLRLRQKELALRTVCGASGGSLLAMLSVEFILTLLFAVVLGGMLTQLLHKPFLSLSDIQMLLPSIYRELFMYIMGVIFISLLIFWLILLIYRRRSLNVSIHRTNKNLSRKISLVVQLMISIGFAFSAMVIMKQMYYLHHTDDLGFSFHGRASVMITERSSDREGVYGVIANHLKQIPEITELIDVGGAFDIFSVNARTHRVESWDNQSADAEPIIMTRNEVSSEYLSFYNFRLLTGELLTAADPDSLVLLNENAVKILGWHDPVGKKIDGFTVKGVVKNVYKLAPTIEAKPILYTNGNNSPAMRFNPGLGFFYIDRTILFTYHEGMWRSCREKIEQLMNREFAENSQYTISNSEEEYHKLLQSENALIKLLSFFSAICVIICVFGFVSLVSLTCEERRKEIAIRKINGATAGDILSMLAKEYLLLLVIGAIIAFTAGYFIMQRWLEHYAIRTGIPAWIYLSIILVFALVIVLCVGWRVYRASIENPAEVVKAE